MIRSGGAHVKILGINSSPRGRKSQTLRLVKGVLGGARAAGASVELVDLCRLNIEYCRACQTCFKTGQCIHRDDFDGLYRKMLRADGVVVGSPNYFGSVSAQCKTFLDRMADGIHCQVLTGKYACAVSTSGGPEWSGVANYLNDAFLRMGAWVVGGAGASEGRTPGAIAAAEKQAVRLGGTLTKAIANQRTYPDQRPTHDAMRERFRDLVLSNKDTWLHEYDYWSVMGWLSERTPSAGSRHAD
jgi:multimeric flavodoxin WrbA